MHANCKLISSNREFCISYSPSVGAGESGPRDWLGSAQPARDVCTTPATGSGNLILVGIQCGGGTDTGITMTGIADNVGNTYSEAGPARWIDTGIGTVVDAWHAQNSAPGATSITLNVSAAVSQVGVVIGELLGVDTTRCSTRHLLLNNPSATVTPVSAATNTPAAGVAIALA